MRETGPYLQRVNYVKVFIGCLISAEIRYMFRFSLELILFFSDMETYKFPEGLYMPHWYIADPFEKIFGKASTEDGSQGLESGPVG